MRGVCKDKIYQGELILKFVVVLLLLILFPSEGFSINFSINPIRIFFEGGKKTDILRIKNESSKSAALQINAFAWTQDEKGDDVYSPTEDILFYPKLMEIHPEQEKLIRIGNKVSRSDTEKTYRLFIEEIPDNSQPETTSVRILMKVGVPIFIAPIKADASGVIESIELSKGSLRMAVKNEGNTHFIIKSIKVEGKDRAGKEAYSVERAGGYLHYGKSKEFAFEIPDDACQTMKTLNVHIDTDRLMMEKHIEIVGEMCGP
jgi:fimbrial chaperone protein